MGNPLDINHIPASSPPHPRLPPPKSPPPFGQKGTLSTHEKAIHLNQKDHKCEVCGKSFGDKQYLSKHAKTIHLKEKDH